MAGTLALMVRSLRVDVRLLRTHLFRAMLVLLIYFALISAQQMSRFLGAPGLRFFEQITLLNFLMITLAGISFLATTITEEKDEGTLGLLRMAGISPVALLVGKSAPRLIAAALLLSVQFPFTFLAITLGGVTSHQIIAAYAALLAYLVLLSGLGLFCSVVSRRSRGASTMMVVVLLTFLVFIPLGQLGLTGPPTATPPAWVRSTARLLGWISDASPYSRMIEIMQTGFAAPIVGYQVVSNIVAAAALFGLAWVAFGRFNRHDVSEPGQDRPFLGHGRHLRWFGLPRASGWAILWKEFHFGTGGRAAMVGKLVAYGLMIAALLWLYASETGRWRRLTHEAIGGVMMASMAVAAAVELALYAARMFHDEVKWRTLPGLMLLPTSIPRIAWSKVAGSLLALTPATAWFVLGAVTYPQGLGDVLENLLGEPGSFYSFTQYFLLLHLTGFLSLFVKWGALPLSFVLIYVWNMFLMSLFLFGRAVSDTGIFILFSVLACAAMVALQFAIAQRLKTLAAR